MYKSKLKSFTLKRYVIEEYEVYADSLKQAKNLNLEDPSKVTIVKVTGKKNK